jgi:hypothetical protein
MIRELRDCIHFRDMQLQIDEQRIRWILTVMAYSKPDIDTFIQLIKDKHAEYLTEQWIYHMGVIPKQD